VSSELERLLREAREALPDPDEDSTLGARRRALATLRRSRARTRVLVLVGATVVAAVALGVTAGSLNAPTGTAAREPAVLGFVPEPGWFALQSPPPAVPGQQTLAVAANVPFASDDVVHGLVEPSGLPYSTLLRLPPRGIVIVSTMTPETSPHPGPVPANPAYPKAELPLHIRNGVTYVQWGAQVRPDEPLGQYQLRARIRNYDVDVVAYFGSSRPSDALIAEAQRQLNGLVVRPAGSSRPAAAAPTASPAAAVAVIDRTYTCETSLLGGLYELKSRAHAGVRRGSTWAKLPFAMAASGGWAGPLTGLPNAAGNSLAWISAGTPSSSTTVDLESQAFPVLSGGTLGVNQDACRPSTASVPLTSAGLRGGAVRGSGVYIDCGVPRRLLVRLRATVRGSTALRDRARIFLATNAPASEAKLAVRTPAGKAVAYADVAESGATRLFTAKGCAAG
jgi:hypothetical protein